MNHFPTVSPILDAAEQHQAEQEMLTQACENGGCDHADCSSNKPWQQRVEEIMVATQDNTDNNNRRAVRSLRAILPEYDNFTLKSALIDALSDLRHLCDLAGWDFSEISSEAHKVYSREVVELGNAQDAELYAIIEDQL